MNKLERFGTNSDTPGVLPRKDRIALYDQYGSMAYGIILRILRQPELAQRVLVDVFASPELQAPASAVTNPATTIIRLAREKALAARPKELQNDHLSLGNVPPKQENLASLVFDLSFSQGYKPETVAEQLQMTYADVMRAIRDHFAYLRNR